MSADQKHIFITGGGSGVGKAIAIHMHELGHIVCIMGRNEAKLSKLCDQYENINYLVGDVAVQADMIKAVQIAKAKFGVIDVMVANAGIANSQPFSKIDEKQFDQMMDINVKGVFNAFQASVTDMKAQGFGRLISIASTAGLRGYAYVSHYCASKFAVIGLTKALAKEYARSGITVNAICPSYLNTEMTERTIENIMDKTGLDEAGALKALVKDNPQQRLVEPIEVAKQVAFLCEEGASSINGQALSICGGEL